MYLEGHLSAYEVLDPDRVREYGWVKRAREREYG
jgi:hypothetical protein